MEPWWVDTLKLALGFLFGTGGGWIASLVRARRARKKEETERPMQEDRAAIAITEQLQALAKASVEGVARDLAQMRTERDADHATITRLQLRVGQLERVIRENGHEVPAEFA